MKFKDVLIQSEWPKINHDLRAIVSFVDLYVKRNYDIDIVVTCLMRSQAQQDFIYKDDPNYKTKPWHSVHQYGRGADIRTSNLDDIIIDEIMDLLLLLPYGDGKHKTALLHEVGDNGKHIHIQVKQE
jgi:hypothetical protein